MTEEYAKGLAAHWAAVIQECPGDISFLLHDMTVSPGAAQVLAPVVEWMAPRVSLVSAVGFTQGQSADAEVEAFTCIFSHLKQAPIREVVLGQITVQRDMFRVLMPLVMAPGLVSLALKANTRLPGDTLSLLLDALEYLPGRFIRIDLSDASIFLGAGGGVIDQETARRVFAFIRQCHGLEELGIESFFAPWAATFNADLCHAVFALGNARRADQENYVSRR
jgi:hypothetical protein